MTAVAPVPLLTRRQINLIVGGLMVGMFLAALDQMIVATAMRTIGDDLDGLTLQAWVQDSGHGVIICACSGLGFDLVAQDEISTGVAGLGGGEVLTQLGDGSGGTLCGQRVKADRQDTVAGVDVAAAGQCLSDQVVGFVVRAGVPGMDSDRSGPVS